MSVTQTNPSAFSGQDISTTTWAREINDLQKYRDSLKVMAERVSRAEYSWAKSLEPQDLIPQKPPQPRHARKWSKSKRPTPLKRPTTPKRIRTDGGMFSPDPFQLLSPSACSDEASSPASATSCRSPYLRGRRPKRTDETSPVDDAESPLPPVHSADIKAQQLLSNAEDLLNDAIQYVNAAARSTKDSPVSERNVQGNGATKARSAIKQVRSVGVQVQALVSDARKYSKLVPLDDDLFKNPMEEYDGVDLSTKSRKHLSDVARQIKIWTSAIERVRERIVLVIDGHDDDDDVVSSPQIKSVS